MTQNSPGDIGGENGELTPPAYAPEYKLREYEDRGESVVPYPPEFVDYPVDWSFIRQNALQAAGYACRMCGTSIQDCDLHVQYYAPPESGGGGVENVIVWCSDCAGDDAPSASMNTVSASSMGVNLGASTSRRQYGEVGDVGDTGEFGEVGDVGEEHSERIRQLVGRGKGRLASCGAAIADDMKLTAVLLGVLTARLLWLVVTAVLAVGVLVGLTLGGAIAPIYGVLSLASGIGLLVMRSLARTSSFLPGTTVTGGVDEKESNDTSDTDDEPSPSEWAPPRFVFEALALRITLQRS